jgi:hypothetical protein
LHSYQLLHAEHQQECASYHSSTPTVLHTLSVHCLAMFALALLLLLLLLL